MEDPPDPQYDSANEAFQRELSFTHSFTYSLIQSFNSMAQYEPVNDADNSAATTTASVSVPSNNIFTIKTVSTSLVYAASLAYFIFSEQNIIV
ncbi:hypothetical protein B5S33_g5597 [[Candida] boidinii]|nr:hypothetical protein B5S30_g5489 [[Candida] boidinii]OWB86875.1 hypothetical protein B5S33_g5597 [[Candida] boidinii]